MQWAQGLRAEGSGLGGSELSLRVWGLRVLRFRTLVLGFWGWRSRIPGLRVPA